MFSGPYFREECRKQKIYPETSNMLKLLALLTFSTSSFTATDYTCITDAQSFCQSKCS